MLFHVRVKQMKQPDFDERDKVLLIKVDSWQDCFDEIGKLIKESRIDPIQITVGPSTQVLIEGKK